MVVADGIGFFEKEKRSKSENSDKENKDFFVWKRKGREGPQK
jgi:hypothetical protein